MPCRFGVVAVLHGVTVSVAVREAPPEVPVIVTVIGAVTALVSTCSHPDAAPAGISTLGGSGSAALLLVSEITLPQAGAGPLSATERVVIVPPFTDAGLVDSVASVGTTTGTSVTVAVFDPPL